MAKKDERNLNITINNNEDTESEVVVSLTTLLKKFKKYLMIWFAVAVACFIAVGIYAIFRNTIKKPEISAYVSFAYNGIEKGLDPDGRKFDINSLKCPEVIEAALTELDYDLDKMESIRQGIYFRETLPSDTLDRLTAYKSILDQGTNSSLTAAEKMLETTYHPTQFSVFFNYNDTGFTDDQAVEVFNKILECYEDYFYKKYGYNEAIGNAVTAISYSDYDYAEAIDVFDTSLDSLYDYVKALAKEDKVRYRSDKTGYTFADLAESINMIREIDLDKISAYISMNNITKDKDNTLAYYEYRIKALNRQKAQLEEQYNAIDASIDKYEKDQIIVFGGTDDVNTQSKVASAQYDSMFGEKTTISNNLAKTKQRINYYKEKLNDLKDGKSCTPKMMERVDKDLAALDEKVGKLIQAVSDTADDYYRSITFGKAYNVLVPASNTTSFKIKNVINNAKLPVIVLEAFAFMAYCAVSFIEAVAHDTRKRKAMKNAYPLGGTPDEEGEKDADKEEAEDDKKDKKKKTDEKTEIE